MLNFLMGYGYMAPPVVHVQERNLPTADDRLLQARVDALELALAGVWRLLKAQGFTDDQLVKAMEEADLADGTKDRRINPVAQKCPNCGHKLLSRQSKKCLWCGADLPAAPI